jgi:hypothetical protein
VTPEKQSILAAATPDEPYFIEVDNNGCHQCGHARTWVVVYGPEELGGGTSYANEEEASEISEMMNDAFGRGRNSAMPGLPADWMKDSSLESWFPLAAEILKWLKTEHEAQSALIERLVKVLERVGRCAGAAEGMCNHCKEAITAALGEAKKVIGA